MVQHSSKVIFCSIAAQSDNLGDVEIRQTLLEWLAATQMQVKVFVGNMPQSYIDAYNLPRGWELYTSQLRFQTDLVRHVVRRRAHLVFAPGPQGLVLREHRRRTKRLMSVSKSAVNLANCALVRLSGGKVVSVGRSVRTDHSIYRVMERARFYLSDIYTVRDSVTSSVLDINVEVTPDLAFVEAIESYSHQKDLAVFSLRGDSPVVLESLTSAVEQVRKAGLKPVFLVQVKSDEQKTVDLAQKIGATVVTWGDRSHKEQMDVVKRTYNRADIVISDRLHALIFGCRSGALPVAVVHPGKTKLQSTLMHLSIPLQSVASNAPDWILQLDMLEQRDELFVQVHRARARVDHLRSRVVSLLRGNETPGTA